MAELSLIHGRRGARPTAQTGLAAALHIPAWVRAHPDEARILILHRQEDFIGRQAAPPTWWTTARGWRGRTSSTST